MQLGRREAYLRASSSKTTSFNLRILAGREGFFFSTRFPRGAIVFALSETGWAVAVAVAGVGKSSGDGCGPSFSSAAPKKVENARRRLTLAQDSFQTW